MADGGWPLAEFNTCWFYMPAIDQRPSVIDKI
jgi:hypothetical protein